MFVKVEKSTPKTDNKGSSSGIISYLSKENEGKNFTDTEGFFNHDNSTISETEAQLIIDNQNKNIGKKDAKFFTFTINPHENELKHIAKIAGNNTAKNYQELTPIQQQDYQKMLKSYTKNVMELYAENFDKNIEGKDLVYVAKMEQQRTYKSFSKEVKENEAVTKKIHNQVVFRIRAENKIEASTSKSELKKAQKEFKIVQGRIDMLKSKYHTIDNKTLQNDKENLIKRGSIKEGFQTHMHIVVHRNTKDYVKISPNAKSRGHTQDTKNGSAKIGFDHERFKTNSGKMFEEQFNYKQSRNEKFTPSNPISKSGNIVKNKLTSKIKSEITKNTIDPQTMKMYGSAIKVKALISTLAKVSNPKALALDILKRVAKEIFKEIR